MFIFDCLNSQDVYRKCFSTSKIYNLRHALQWKSCALEHRAIAGVYHQLSNAYLNYSKANILPTVKNLTVARLATHVEQPHLFIYKGDSIQVRAPTQVSSLGPKFVYFRDQISEACVNKGWFRAELGNKNNSPGHLVRSRYSFYK
jgi:hypothetical protein